MPELQPPRSTVLPIELLTSPFVRFARMEAAGGILLLASTIAALVWANSPWEHSYVAIWDVKTSIGFGKFVLSESRREWINDGLMAGFFFLVGFEIKREVQNAPTHFLPPLSDSTVAHLEVASNSC